MSAYYVGDYADAALWLLPNVHPDVEAVMALLQSTASGGGQKDDPTVFEKMDSYHPSKPHWYLPLLGVDPLQHCKGLGSALMQHAINRCDRDNMVGVLRVILG